MDNILIYFIYGIVALAVFAVVAWLIFSSIIEHFIDYFFDRLDKTLEKYKS